MNIEKYRNNGWGLSKSAFQLIEKYLLELFNEYSDINIIEFGSGISTEFLVDFKLNYNKNINITSFDNSSEYCYKNKNNYEFLDLKIRDLLTCDDNIYENMFINKKFNKNEMKIKEDISTTRQKNCFYNIKENDLKEKYNFVIIDGPNGNGRNFSFLVLNGKLEKGSYIFIDDYNHYDFVDRMKSIYNCELIKENNGDFRNDKWNNGGGYVLYKII